MSTYGAALTALADPTRRTVLELVARRPRPVGELAEELPVSRPAVSQHLRVLKDAGLVRERAVGTRRIYEVDRAGFDAVRAWFDGFWSDALDRFAQAAGAATTDDGAVVVGTPEGASARPPRPEEHR